jgi:glutaredoxin
MHFHMITMQECIWCDKAKKLIEERGHTFTEELATRENMKGFKTVPQIWENENMHYIYVGGYEALVKYLGED